MLFLNGYSVLNCSNGYTHSKLTGENVALNFQSNPECVSLVAGSVEKHFSLACRCKIIEARQRPTATLLPTWVPRFWESTQGLYTGSHPSSELYNPVLPGFTWTYINHRLNFWQMLNFLHWWIWNHKFLYVRTWYTCKLCPMQLRSYVSSKARYSPFKVKIQNMLYACNVCRLLYAFFHLCTIIVLYCISKLQR